MNIGIIGSNGYLGNTLKSNFLRFHNVIPIKIRINDNSDLTNINLRSIIETNKIDVIVNCSAIIGFLNCYNDSKNAYLVNSVLPYLLCSECNLCSVKFYHISTEAVFPSGIKNSLYSETDVVDPETVYGNSKFIGEQSISNFSNSVIIRLPRLFGWGNQIVYQLYKKIQNREKIKVSTDLYSTPVHVKLVAQEILKIIENKILSKFGNIIHITGDTLLSLYDLMKKILDKNKLIFLEKTDSSFFNNDNKEPLLLNCGLISLNDINIPLSLSIKKFLDKE